MAKVDLVMPQMGESIAEGTIIKWLKKEGDKVERDEIVLEISTDKVDSEIPSPHEGVIKKILAPEGETVKVGSKIAEIETDGEGGEAVAEEAEAEEGKAREQPEAAKAEAEEAEAEAEEEKEEAPAEAKAPETEEKPSEEEREEAPPEPKAEEKPVEPAAEKEEAPKEARKRKFYSPLVRSIARAEGISEEELEQVEGTGANGRVTKNDILNYIKQRAEKAPAAPAEERAPAYEPAPTPAPERSDERVEVIPMDHMRKSVAKHMVHSVHTSPHVFAVSEADMTNLVKFREKNKDAFLKREGFKLTYMPFIIDACVRALRDFPLVNSSVQDDKIIRKKYINIGMAVALPNNGLIVPVIKGADGMNIVGVARTGADLANRARNRQLKPDEVQDGTFTITNMGVFGSLMGLPIIHQPQVAILGVGAIQKRPVVINDAIAIRDMMYISLSFDHRIVDGALGGQFLDRVAHYLSNYDTENLSI